MNKDSIYKIIGYNGEYNSNVKKAIRKLLKENHPDKNGDPKIFELINEVKNELENGKVSYKFDSFNSEIKKDDFIDYSYQMREKIIKERNIYTKKLDKIKEKLEKYNVDYKKKYRESVDLETYLLTNSKYSEELKMTKYSSIIILTLTIIVFIISVWKESLIVFILFVFLVIVCIYTIRKAFIIMHKISENSKKNLNRYVGVNSKLRRNIMEQEELKREMNEINKTINNLENDLRFYDNIFSNRG